MSFTRASCAARINCSDVEAGLFLMKNVRLIFLSLVAVVFLGGCKSFKWNSSSPATRAEQLKKDGAAADMAEAQRMAADRDWIENAQRKEELERQKRSEAAQKK